MKNVYVKFAIGMTVLNCFSTCFAFPDIDENQGQNQAHAYFAQAMQQNYLVAQQNLANFYQDDDNPNGNNQNNLQNHNLNNNQAPDE